MMASGQRIAFIGGGNMASSLIAGIFASGYPSALINVSEPDQAKVAGFGQLYGVNTFHDNTLAAASADIIILAVKPSILAEVCAELAPIIHHHPLMISIAAGISLTQLNQWLGAEEAIVRVMPNISSKVLQGVSGLCANAQVSPAQQGQAEALFKTVGVTAWFTDEHLLHAVTALSGSGPAYYFLFMEAMAQAAVDLGLSPEIAKAFSIQTALGAATLATTSNAELAELRQQVISPNGTTARAIQVMEAENIRALMHKALLAAYQRSIELSN